MSWALPLLGLAVQVRAEPPVGSEIHDILDLSLEDLLDAPTTTATKSSRTARQTPAIVTVPPSPNPTGLASASAASAGPSSSGTPSCSASQVSARYIAPVSR